MLYSSIYILHYIVEKILLLIIILYNSTSSSYTILFYAQIFNKVSQLPVHKASPLGETPTHETRLS